MDSRNLERLPQGLYFETMTFALFREMHSLTPLSDSVPLASLDVSLLIPARNSGHALEKTVQEAHRFLSVRYPGAFEIILIPNPALNPPPGAPKDESTEISESLSARFAHVKTVRHYSPSGKGAALRTGFLASRGQWILFTDADLPYDLEFFDRAMEKLRNGYHFVTGNRRLGSSHFNVPVDLLRLAYGRHRLGLAFNQVVRWLFPIKAIDTQAGIKAMSRDLAAKVFSLQRCPGFFFDLEFFLTARCQGFRHVDLPVTLYLNSEKSTVRVFRESILAGFWLARIWWLHRLGSYGRAPRRRGVLARYRNASFSTRLFLKARWHLTPYLDMAEHLPVSGPVLDLGCGHGLLAIAIALDAPDRAVYGIDHDVARVELAKNAASDLPNIRFNVGTMDQIPAAGPYSGIAMIDVYHYFKPETQEELARRAFAQLQPGGTLLVREVEPQGGFASSWNKWYEKLATASGFTQADRAQLHFRTTRDWEDLFRKTGFKVKSRRCGSRLFSDVLFICDRPRIEAPEGSS